MKPVFAGIVLLLAPSLALAGPAGSPMDAQTPDTAAPGFVWSDLAALHLQSTGVWQGHDSFHAPYTGPQSLAHDARGDETWDLTLYGGLHPWKGGELWLNGEVDQGFGISNTTGLAGFSSGEAYKLGRTDPYFRLQRAFIRQTFNLGGAADHQDPDLNSFALPRRANRLVITAGKFAVTDIFDANSYAHDPRADFLNWSLIDTGTFDYAADSWGYTVGSAIEWYQGRWTARLGGFLMSNVPNSPFIDTSFHQFQTVMELEERHEISGCPGIVRLTGFLTHARMARFNAAIAYGLQGGLTPSYEPVRHFGNRPGIGLSVEQDIAPSIGMFLRAGWADGHVETYEFTDIDESIAAGTELEGHLWHREEDKFRLGGALNAASPGMKRYLAAGGLGLLVGDGQLPHPGLEHILEAGYDAVIGPILRLSLDYQWVANPAYNRDRGPVSIGAVRLHAQY